MTAREQARERAIDVTSMSFAVEAPLVAADAASDVWEPLLNAAYTLFDAVSSENRTREFEDLMRTLERALDVRGDR